MSISRILLPALALWMAALAIELLAISEAIQVRSLALAVLVFAGIMLATTALAAVFIRTISTSVLFSLIPSASVGLAAAAIHILPMASEPLASLVEDRSTVVVVGIVQSDGRVLDSPRQRLWQAEPEYQFQLASSPLTAGSQAWAAELPLAVTGTQPAPPIGSLVRMRGVLSPGELPSIAAFVRTRGDIEILSEPGVIDRLANELRAGLGAALLDRPADAASLVAGLTIGDQSQQPEALEAAMRTAGLAHLTAVSGGNVAVIIVMAMGLARWCRLRLGLQVVCCLAALAFFVVLVRPQPSVLRATVMGAVVLIGLLTGGQRRGTGVLAISIALLVTIAPELAVSWGFALSVAATGGLILCAPWVLAYLQSNLGSWPRYLLEGLAVTIAAQLATVPIVIAMGSTVGLASVPANLLAMPVVPLVTVLGLATAALGTLAPALAVFTGLIASWLASWIATVAFAMASMPLAIIPWPAGAFGAFLALVLLGALLLCARLLRMRFPNTNASRRRIGILSIVAVLMLLIPWLIAPRSWPMPDWIFVACDVGQGDALVVRTGVNSAMLIDAGLDGRDVDRCLQQLHVTTLDVVVLSHFHVDHVGGLNEAIGNRTVGAVFATPTLEPVGEARRVQKALTDRGLVLQPVQAGERHQLAGLSWQVLWPARQISEGSVPNNASVVLLIDVDGLRILLAGDIEPEAQAALMAEYQSVHADIAKIPHHGSRFQDPRFAQWADAQLAVVTVGESNDYGHPAPSALSDWQHTGAAIWRTDLHGSIAVARREHGTLAVVALKP